MIDLQELLADMGRNGIVPHDPDFVPEIEKINRFRLHDERKGKKSGYCWVDESGAKYYSWRDRSNEFKWDASNGTPPSPEELKRRLEKRKKRKEAEAREQVEFARRYSEKTATLEPFVPDEQSDDYFSRKQIQAYGNVKLGQHYDGSDAAWLPLQDAKGDIWTVQSVRLSDGEKYNEPGGAISAHFFLVGEVSNKATLILCEGYATGCTLHELSGGFPVACAMSSYNMSAVAKALVAEYPDIKLVVCPDDDWKTQGNPGLKAAAEVLSVPHKEEWLALPPRFDEETRGDKDVDWNDLAVKEGKVPARIQLSAKIPKPAIVPVTTLMLRAEEDQRVHILGPYIVEGRMSAVIGQMGVGKTRHLNFLPVSFLSGQPWYKCPWTTQEPVRFVFLSAESDDYDWREQFGPMAAKYNVPFNTLASSVFCLDTSDPRNEFIDFTDPIKVRPDIKAFLRPHYKHLCVVVVDPCTNFAPTDLNSGEEMSRWVASVKRIVLDCIPRAAIVVAHHARPGKGNLKDVLGYDALGYAANSKNLARHANAVINFIPGDPEEPGSVNIIACPKVKRARPFKPFAVVLDDSSMSYDIDEHFDIEEWKADVDGKQSPNQKANISAVVQVVQFKSQSGEIKKEVAALCDCSTKTAEKWLNKSVAEGYVEPKNGKFGKYSLTDKGTDFLEKRIGV